MNRRGFTLVELLIALSILAIGILAVSTMQLNATRNGSVGDVLSMGLAVAESKVELLRSSDPAVDLADGTAVDTACELAATYDQITYAVDCSYDQECEAADGVSCPPGRFTRVYRVEVSSEIQSNPIVLTGKLPL